MATQNMYVRLMSVCYFRQQSTCVTLLRYKCGVASSIAIPKFHFGSTARKWNIVDCELWMLLDGRWFPFPIQTVQFSIKKRRGTNIIKVIKIATKLLFMIFFLSSSNISFSDKRNTFIWICHNYKQLSMLWLKRFRQRTTHNTRHTTHNGSIELAVILNIFIFPKMLPFKSSSQIGFS